MIVTREKMLVIDDAAPIVKMYEVAFGVHYEVVTARNREDIEALSGKESFKYIITDYNLPGLPFESLLQKLKEGYPDAKILLITGSDEIDRLREEHSQDFEVVLQKPINIIELRDMIKPE